MRFTQIIEFRTSRLPEMIQLQKEWESESGGADSTTTVQFCVDREDPEHCMVIATFNSYEEAMAVSQMPETGRNAEAMGRLADGPPRFYNLDVVNEMASTS